MPLRDYSLTVLPPWLLDQYGSAWARAHGDVKDGLAALLKERVAARFPIRPGATELAPYAPPGALEATGRDRLMPRAIGEADAGYAARLADAWAVHALGGTPWGALRALAAAGYPEAMLVIRSQRLYKLDADGELVVETLPPGNWCYEPEPQPFWSRYSVLFCYPNLPPAWPTIPGDFIIGAAVPSNPDTNTPTPPLLALLDSPPQHNLTVRVEFLAVEPTGQTDNVTYRYRTLPTNPWRTVETNTSDDPVPLLDGDGDEAFFSLKLLSDTMGGTGDGYVPGEAYEWTVTATSQYVLPPSEESREMGVIRTLAKECNNAAATLMGITIVGTGRAWGYPVRTWGQAAASGDTWGRTTQVVNYHP